MLPAAQLLHRDGEREREIEKKLNNNKTENLLLIL